MEDVINCGYHQRVYTLLACYYHVLQRDSRFFSIVGMDIHNDLSHPLWLKKALANPKRFWGTWPLLAEREAARAALSAKSRDYYDANDREDNPFSVWTGALNRGKNRFGVEAYDRNRVILADDPDRYVNASYVREGAGGRWWVAAEVRSFFYVSFFYNSISSNGVYTW